MAHSAKQPDIQVNCYPLVASGAKTPQVRHRAASGNHRGPGGAEEEMCGQDGGLADEDNLGEVQQVG
jgi:hypothetical protein